MAEDTGNKGVVPSCMVFLDFFLRNRGTSFKEALSESDLRTAGMSAVFNRSAGTCGACQICVTILFRISAVACVFVCGQKG